LKQRGFSVIEGECLRQQVKGKSATSRQRASELTKFLTDPSVAAVMPPWGGELAIELLDEIDFKALARFPAKWFSGFSDLSTLHLPLTICAGWATLHGPNLMQLGAPELDITTAGLWDILCCQPPGEVIQQSSSTFEKHGAPEDGNSYEKTQWKRLDGSTASIDLQGRLIGGCLDTISRLAGSPYGDVPAFIRSAGTDGALLYLENAELKPFELARALHGLAKNGWFVDLQGVLIGRSAAPDACSPEEFTYLDALRSALDGICCPVLCDLDIGHVSPQNSLVNGALAKVEFSAGAGVIVQRLGSGESTEQTSFGSR
jgi:muramoyltetrapeptide carboxypeptidase LdcA involved in peptidoglycan recycling